MFTPNEFGQMIFEMKYAAPGESTWQQRCKVVADHISSCENEENRQKVRDKFYKVLSEGDLVPGGRILFGSGRARYNLLNCYVIVPDDSVASIGKTIQDMYKISCAGGGIGFNFSKIRPKGDDIQNIRNSAPGSVSVMKMINEIGNHVRAGKNRRTALMGILDVTHPDILEFLHVKLDLNQLENFNISVGITDRFIEACENGEDWHFTFHNRKYYIYVGDRVSPKLDENGVDTGEKIRTKVRVVGLSPTEAEERAKQHYLEDFRDQFENFELHPLKAMELFALIWDNAVRSGDPGIYNVSKANTHTNVSYFENMAATNPCGEIPLPSYGNCCLGHVNLANMVDEDGNFNWKRLAAAVRAGIRFLDNVLDVNTYPVQETREVAHKSRRIGLGVLGYHYMLIKLGIKYGSEQCLEFTERLAQTFRDEAYKTSIYIAKEKGSFSAFDSKKYLDESFAKQLPARIRFLIKKHGIRNAVMLTSAPTGTTSIVLGVSSGIELIFALRWCI
jgi:ribonucleoside-diphosphate reductase alpha chain